jgi:ABC-2 type transport system permease protein
MLYQIFAITLKDLQILIRDRGGLASLFLMPVMFILVMSTALRGAFSAGGSNNPTPLVVVNLDAGDLADKAIGDLKTVDGIKIEEMWEGQPVTRDLAEQLIRDGKRRVAIVFPADFSERVLQRATDLSASAAIVTFIADPASGAQFLGPIQGSVQGFILRVASYAQAPQQIGAAFDQMAAQADPQSAPIISQIGKVFVQRLENGGGLEGSATDSPVTFETIAPAEFKVQKFPDSVQQSVPGYALFGIFFIAQVLATSILREKQEGTFRRLLVAPLPRAALLIGKLLPYYLVNLTQVALMFAVGVVVFKMSLGNDPLALVLVTLAASASSTGLGLLVSALGKTPEQIGGLSALLVVTLAALGGVMVPTFIMPPFMQTLSKISPHAWALAGYQDVIVRGLGVSAVLPEVGVLMVFAAIFFGIAVWRFRFE